MRIIPPRAALPPILLGVGALFVSSLLFVNTLEARFERDVSSIVFDDNVELLDDLRRSAGLESDSLSRVLASSAEPSGRQAYLVVSIRDHRIWYKHGDTVLFTASVATGSGQTLEHSGGDAHWNFETPRGRLSVISKETNPVWVPPDWHFIEQAQKRGLGVVQLARGQSLATPDGGSISVSGADVVRRSPSGQVTVVDASDERELVSGGNIIIPPLGTNQRQYKDVLGTHRLNLGGGYALHGTNKPETIGRSVSHGCVRLRNEDIATLYEIVPLGTPVFIY